MKKEMILFLGNRLSIIFCIFLMFFLEIVMVGFGKKKASELQNWKKKSEVLQMELKISNEIEIEK